MKKTVTLILALVLVLALFAGCSPKAEVDTSADRLRVISATHIHTPQQNWLYTYEDGLTADGTRLTVEEMITKTESTGVLTYPFALDPGGAIDTGVYSVYDLEGNPLYLHRMVFSEPQEPGTYLCVLEINFGTEEVYSGYQMFWRFVIADPAAGAEEAE